MAQCLIRPGSGPKQRSTLPMSLPATCSVECLKGRRVPVRGRHAQSMPAIAAAWYATVASLRPPEVDAELVPSLTRTLSASFSPSLSTPARERRAPPWPSSELAGAALFSPLSPPRSSRATPSASPPSPARRARARRPKPRWEHCSRRPPSLPTAGAHGRSTTGLLSAIRDRQRVREDTLVLILHFTAAVNPPPAEVQPHRRAPLLCSATRGLGLKFDEGRGSNCEVCDSNE
jgi:hypothetical protein